MRLLIAIVAWVGAIIAAIAVSTAVSQSIHTTPAASAVVTGASAASGGSGSNAGGGSNAGAQSAPPDPSSIKSTDSLSLFRTANLAQALATVRSHLGANAKIDTFALYPGYLALTAVKGGGAVEVYIPSGGSYSQTSGGSPGGTPLFSLSQVKAGVPAALAHRIATSGHVPESQLNYFVVEVDPSDNKFRWLVYPKQGGRVEYFQATGATGQLLEYRTNSATGLQPVR